jgi:hypothetical protein
MLGKNLIQAAAGNAGGAGGVLGVEDVFSTWLYTGNSSTQTITNGIDLAGEGGLVWQKARTISDANALIDTARGVNKVLYSDTNFAEVTSSSRIASFDSTGFTAGSYFSGYTVASWTFRKAEKFFDVITWTGDAANVDASRTIAHNLGSTPGTIIVKRTDNAADWQVYHRSLGATKYMILNTTAGESTSIYRWRDTEPTSSVFTVGYTLNAPGNTYVAYVFAHDAGGFGDDGTESVIKCGSFTTDGGGNATVNLGWEPQWLLAKRNEAGEPWVIADNMRGWTAGGSGSFPRLEPNTANAEANTPSWFGPTSTGFVAGGNSGANKTYIYIAIRRGPMKTPTDATKVFATAYSNGTSNPRFTSNFPVDTAFLHDPTDTGTSRIDMLFDRMRGSTRQLNTNSTAAEFTTGWSNYPSFDYSNGWATTFSSSWLSWMFRRAPGFFDVVAYTGTGSATTVSHNLGVTPELMIVKRRNSAAAWPVYAASLTATDYLQLQSPNSKSTYSGVWNNTEPTSTVFTVGTDNWVNASGSTYIAYLFATLPGISKVGSYTGTGTTLNVDCGFTAGARFVLIKQTNDNGTDWYVWDTARGIVSGNDPYLLLNSTAAQVTSTDYIDPLSSGFQISSTAPAAINASGGSYIFLAIA